MPNTVDKPLYTPGDIGPAGGFIFYDKGFTSDGWRYLEAAPAGAEFKAPWGLKEVVILGTSEFVGSGKKNSEIITSKGADTAASMCKKLMINGYNDWFLPSKDELDLMYHALQKQGKGFFLSGIYWSSFAGKEGKENWYQGFNDGAQASGFHFRRSNELIVRAIRAF